MTICKDDSESEDSTNTIQSNETSVYMSKKEADKQIPPTYTR